MKEKEPHEFINIRRFRTRMKAFQRKKLEVGVFNKSPAFNFLLKAYRFFFLCRFLRSLFFRLWVAIL